jgi:uncharacterized protein (DUF486 family)
MNASLSVSAQTVLLLVGSNLFMTFAWYGHLKTLSDKPLLVAVLASWAIALFEYLLQVPANRIGFAGGFSLAQLKITQEVITLGVFVPFAMLYMGQPFKLDFVWAGCAWSAPPTSSSGPDALRRRGSPTARQASSGRASGRHAGSASDRRRYTRPRAAG